MRTRTVDLQCTCMEEYLPPKCRKPRLREINANISVSIQEVTPSELLPAFRWNVMEYQNGDCVTIPRQVFLWDGRLWKNSECEYELSSKAFNRWLKYRLSIEFTANVTEDRIRKRAEEAIRGYIICENDVFEVCKAPFYNVSWNGNAICMKVVENCHYDMFGKYCFRPDEREEALAVLEQRKEMLGLDYAFGTAENLAIEVLLPECITMPSQIPVARFEEIVEKRFLQDRDEFLRSWTDKTASELDLPVNWRQIYGPQFDKIITNKFKFL